MSLVRGFRVALFAAAAEGSALREAGEGSPVARVVGLLREMQRTLEQEAQEDQDLYKKLECWCNTNAGEKDAAILAAQAQISDLESSIKELTASTVQLQQDVEELDAEVATNKRELAEATAMREKESAEFRKTESDALQNEEALKDAIAALERATGAALPQLASAFLKKAQDALDMSAPLDSAPLALAQISKHAHATPWGAHHEDADEREFDEFMTTQDYPEGGFPMPAAERVAQKKFMAMDQSGLAVASGTWSSEATAALARGLKVATNFMQGQQQGYNSFQVTAGTSASGEIIGILKQLQEQLHAQYTDEAKKEQDAVKAFQELRASKTKEIEAGYHMAEAKEDQLAQDAMDCAEAKEDLEQTTATLSEDQKYILNLHTQCKDADANFDERKKSRLAEIKAVGEAVGILTADDARDTIGRALNFLQTSSASAASRSRTAALLRRAARRLGDPSLSVLATSVEIDSFGRVKEAIDKMVAQLKTEQADEVKKNDWCNDQLQSNDVATLKTQSARDSLQATATDQETTVGNMASEIKSAEAGYAQLTVDLQRASENRKLESADFQHTIADQRQTQALILKAIDKLEAFYSSQLQLRKTTNELQLRATAKGRHGHVSLLQAAQTPPAQAEYKPSEAATGIVGMMKKVIQDSRSLEKEAIRGENEAQSQYEQLLTDTNDGMEALRREIAAKTETKAQALKQKIEAESDLMDSVEELEELHKYGSNLHQECDYLTKNFDVRQQARSEEISALQDARNILSGAR